MALERRPTARSKAPSTNRTAKPATSVRMGRVAASANARRKVSPLLIGGIAGGVVILGLVIALLATSGGKKDEKKEEKAGPTASKSGGGPKVDEKLRSAGVAKCEQGLKKLRALEGRIERRRSMSPSDLEQLGREIRDADKLLNEGLTEIENSNAKEHVNEYMNARSSCRSLLKEFSGK